MNTNKKSSWNKNLHTPKIQHLLDTSEIWSEKDVWYRKCPSCEKPIPSKGKSAFHGCIRLYSQKRTCKSCGRKRTKNNLIGKTFGKLKVISEAPYRINDLAPYWKCKCECGKETEVRAFSLTNGITKSCGDGYHTRNDQHYSWKGCKEIPGAYYSHLKKGANSRNINFEISIEDMWKQFEKQDRKCIFTGEILKFSTKSNSYDGTASLDRINSSKGYEKDNIQWIHKDVNRLKNAFSQKRFLELCKSIYEYTLK